MKPHDAKVEKIEKALKSAYRKSSHIRVKPEWEREVMYHILSLHPTPMRTDAVWGGGPPYGEQQQQSA